MMYYAEPGICYRFKVRACNSCGFGKPVVINRDICHCLTPPKPQVCKITQTDDCKEVVINWIGPVTRDSIKEYKIFVYTSVG